MISFNRPYLTGKEIHYIREANLRAQLAGDGYFTRKCQKWLEKNLGSKKAFLTHSCTSALEMAAILADIKTGDEIIIPSFTFVSTATAFALRGAKAVFVDIKPDTLNMDEKLIERAITQRTKAIVPVHYAGVACEMDIILKIARKHRLLVIEDAAHGVEATYKGRELGSIGDFGALSFHETKNIISGEGGALLVNNPKFIKRAEIIWQKGTDRSRFLRGEVDKYTWRDIGSSFLPGELMAAFLWAQLQNAKKITAKRRNSWNIYHNNLETAAKSGFCKRPIAPPYCRHNAHNYYLILKSVKKRNQLLKFLRTKRIAATFHYLPLHQSPYAKRHLLSKTRCPVTISISKRIIRLPFFTSMRREEILKITSHINQFFNKKS